MRFPSQDFSNQYISLSYQAVVQTYAQGTASYLLDGNGNVLGFIPTSSVGQQFITADQPVPLALTASYAMNGGSGGSSISSSWASQSLSSSFATSANTASFTETCLFALNSEVAETAISASVVVSASYAFLSQQAAHSTLSDTSSLSLIALFADTASYAFESTFSDTASLAAYANYAGSSSYAINASQAVSASYAATASWAQNIPTVVSTLFASSSVSSSFSVTASYLLNYAPPVSASWASASSTYAATSSYAITSSYEIQHQISESWSSASLQSMFATQSLYATTSIFASTASGGSWGDFLVNGNVVNTTTNGFYAKNTASDVFTFQSDGILNFILTGTSNDISAAGNVLSLNSGGGNVGINKLHPSYSLDVNGTSNFSGRMICEDSVQFINASLILDSTGNSSIDPNQRYLLDG